MNKQADPETRRDVFRLHVGSERTEPIRTTSFVGVPIEIRTESVMSMTARSEVDGDEVILEISAKTLNGANIDSTQRWAALLRDMAAKIERVKFI